MNLNRFLKDKKKGILKKWREDILEAYPAESKKFLKRQSNRSANPVGHSIFEKTEKLYDEIIRDGNTDIEKIKEILDELIRIRAIQDFSPSQAVGFLHMLKNVIRHEVEGKIENNDLFKDFIIFNNKIDEITYIAFDMYTECREKLFEMKAAQARNQVSGLLRKADLISEIPEWNSR